MVDAHVPLALVVSVCYVYGLHTYIPSVIHIKSWRVGKELRERKTHEKNVTTLLIFLEIFIDAVTFGVWTHI